MKTSTMAMSAALLLALPCCALGQPKPQTEPKVVCTAALPPPAELMGWTSPTPLASARRAADVPKSQLAPGRAVTALLHPVADVTFPVPPEKADGPPVFGGLYGVRIEQTGTYRLASSAAPWIDLYVGKTPVTSSAHSRGPDCTGVGKQVDFPLKPGDYLLQFSESLTPQAEIMLVRLGD